MDDATGSLGQGLPIGVGVALAGKRLEQLRQPLGADRETMHGWHLESYSERALAFGWPARRGDHARFR